MSATETIPQEKKKRKNNQYQIDLLGVDEHEPKSDENIEQTYSSREVTMLVRDKQRQALDQYKSQQDFLRAEMEKYAENMATRRITSRDLKMRGDLSNVIKITLADETITLAKGKETQRAHKKILFGVWHRDEETTTEIEVHRGSGQ